MKHSFEVYQDKRLIFYSDEHWLYPLFSFEVFLEKSHLNSEELLIKDKIVGKAAALLFIYFNIKHVHAVMLSELGEAVLKRWNIDYTYKNLVERIDCQTENILLEENDPDKAYQIIKARIQKSRDRNH
jgi:hypothetical protein